MSVNKIVTKVDGVINKTIDFNDLKAGLSAGAHTITAEAWNGAALISTQTKNITIAAAATYEADTISYMNALGIADNANPSIYTGVSNKGVWLAVDEYIADLKAAAIYTKQHYNYLRVGGDVTKQAVDLIDPNRSGVYFGSWVFGKDGATANGINCYFKAIANPLLLAPTSNNFGMSSVVNRHVAGAAASVQGIYFGISTDKRVQMYLISATSILPFFGKALSSEYTSPTLGFHSINRVSDLAKYHLNGVEKLSASQSGTTFPDAELYEAASNWAHNGTISNYVEGDLGVTAYHQNLTASETLAFSNAVSKFETALGRKRY